MAIEVGVRLSDPDRRFKEQPVEIWKGTRNDRTVLSLTIDEAWQIMRQLENLDWGALASRS